MRLYDKRFWIETIWFFCGMGATLWNILHSYGEVGWMITFFAFIIAAQIISNMVSTKRIE